jgi:putative serine protease PepD
MKRVLTKPFVTALLGAVVATVALLAIGVGGSPARRSAAAVVTPKTTTISNSTSTAGQIYQSASSGVVAIDATSAEEEDTGTGVVLNSSGLILTNDHVISGASSVTVSPGSSSKTKRTAEIVGEDADADLALLKINPAGLDLHPLTLASSSSVKVGDAVYAIGNPYGLDETLTTGIVSALGRQIEAPDGAKINGAIQTDAALNPGNSGGPLLNSQGEVIGINSQIASEESSSEDSQPGSTGVGFAISSNTVAQVVKKIESDPTGATSSSQTEQAQSSQGEQGGFAPYGYGQQGNDPYGDGSSGYTLVLPGA